MAAKGPKPKKPAPKRATGRPSKGDGWECPGHLTGDAREAWGHLVGQLRRVGNLDRTDPVIVEAYAANVALLRAANRAIGERGVLVINGSGAPAPNPACAVVNAASMRLKAIAYDLGLVPATSKYGADPSGGKAQQDDKWAGLLVVG